MKWRWRRGSQAPADQCGTAAEDGPLTLGPDHDRDELFEYARELLFSGQSESGVSLLQALAAEGDIAAQLLLGLWRLESGEVDAAEVWLRPLAARGDAAAMYGLGVISFQRDNDPEMSTRWLLASAARGNPRAMFEIGTSAVRAGDVALGRYWFGRAAVAGDTDAMVNLGVTLLGDDPDGAAMWWRRAAELGNEAAVVNLRSLAPASGPAGPAG
jgi:TPR repeat protein